MNKIILATLAAFTLLASCKRDSFLNRTPQTAFSEETYFKNENDLQLYCNQFYDKLPVQNSSLDKNSDLEVPITADPLLSGSLTIPATASPDQGWDWSIIRACNYFLEKVSAAPEIDATIKKKYIAETRFFRALRYFSLVATFGDVPWVNKNLNEKSPELYAPRDPHKLVMDSVIQDLDYAIAVLPTPTNAAAGRLNKNVALALKSRVCLWEGTYRKYHALGDEQTILNYAVDASTQIMSSGLYKIYNTGNPKTDYRNLFIQEDLSSNTESILSQIYILNITTQGFTRVITSSADGFSKQFIESYLCKDGLPIASSPLYKGDNTYDDELTNRDPRLTQTIPARGYIFNESDGDALTVPRIGTAATSSGYQIIKYRSSVFAQINANQGTTDQFIFRYAETLLNYAEAKAELGTLTQNDLDISINLLRDRVGMPHMIVAALVADPNTLYPSVSLTLQEIRRERAIELAGEGFRFQDIARWKVGPIINNPKSIVGLKLTSAMKSQYDASQISNIVLTPEGYIKVYPSVTQRVWNDKMYLYPLPLDQLSLNTKYKQNPGW